MYTQSTGAICSLSSFSRWRHEQKPQESSDAAATALLSRPSTLPPPRPFRSTPREADAADERSRLARSVESMKARYLLPLSCASWIAVQPVLSTIPMRSGGPACTSTVAAVVCPRMAAQWSGVQPSLSAAATSAPRKISSFTLSVKPL